MIAGSKIILVMLIFTAITTAYSTNTQGICDFEFKTVQISSNNTYCTNLKLYCTCLDSFAGTYSDKSYFTYGDDCVQACKDRNCPDCSTTNSASTITIGITVIATILVMLVQ